MNTEDKQAHSKAVTKISFFKSIRFRVAFLLTLAIILLVFSMARISLGLYTKNTYNEHLAIARGTAVLAAGCIDADKVQLYIENGKVDDYEETYKKLQSIRNNSLDIKYLYAYQIREDGSHIIFDTDESEGDYEVDARLDFDESFLPLVDDLLAGKRIEPIESDDQYGWLLTCYEPVYDSSGKCVLYVGADVSMDTLVNYRKNFRNKIIIYFSGILILFLSIGIWISEFFLVRPLNNMSINASKFMSAKGNVERLKDYVKENQALKIKTGDEVETLYHSFSKMMEDTVRNIENIRTQSDTIAKMQVERIKIMQKSNAELEQKIQDRTQALKVATEKAEHLLLNILPETIAQELTEHPNKTIAKEYPNATVLFTDIVGFTKMSSGMEAEDVVTMLNKMISMFDERAKREGVEKIKTIGDAYMAATGLTEEPFNDGAARMVKFAQGLLSDVQEFNEHSGVKIHIRCGINSGEIVAGVIGKSKFIYDIWGDTVNVASRMESTGVPMKIHVTESVYAQTSDTFAYSESPEIEVKGKGLMKTYFL